jgi:hypothetical protein
MMQDNGDGRRGVYGKLLLLDAVLSTLEDGSGYVCEEWPWLGVDGEAQDVG